MIERIFWPPFLRLRWNSRAKVSSLEGCLKNKKKLKERKGVKLKFKRKSNLYIYISGKLATNRVRTPMKKDLKSWSCCKNGDFMFMLSKSLLLGFLHLPKYSIIKFQPTRIQLTQGLESQVSFFDLSNSRASYHRTPHRTSYHRPSMETVNSFSP